MRKVDKKQLQSYYNRTYVDEPQEFEEESLTNPAFEPMCDVNYLLTHFNGAPRTPIYGEQTDWTFEDWQNERAKILARFNELTPEAKASFGTVANFFKYCSDPTNFTYDEVDNTYKENPPVEPVETGEAKVSE